MRNHKVNQYIIIHDFTWGGDFDQHYAEIEITDPDNTVHVTYHCSIAGWDHEIDRTQSSESLKSLVDKFVETLP